MKPIDPLQLQRLTDGELSISQIKSIIEDAESNPSQWPSIAKALIEDKLWQNQILSTSDSIAAADPLATVSQKTKPAHYQWPQWLSVAGALMVAAIGGYLVAGSGLNATPSPINSAQLADSDPVSPITPATFTPDYHLKFSDNHNLARQGFSPNGEVPLYSINNADELRHFQKQQAFEPVSRELMERLTAAGYRINNNIELISGDFNDQQKFVVPVRTIRLEPSQ